LKVKLQFYDCTAERKNTLFYSNAIPVLRSIIGKYNFCQNSCLLLKPGIYCNMTHKTKGIILRSIKYGETSLIVTVLTELFGIQSYMVSGVRTSKKSSGKAAMFQPSAVLELVVYHNEQKSLQRIKECKWAFLYNHVLSDVVKNSVALYMVELLQKCLKQPEANADLYNFCEDALMQLDGGGKTVTANFALYFSLHLPYFFGFKPQGGIDGDIVDETAPLYFDLQDGEFLLHPPAHLHFIEGAAAHTTAQLLRVMQPYELDEFKLNHEIRRKLLLAYQDFYTLHISEFGQMKTLSIMQTVLG
jgi:DNA repair protein RecO (recombination protein O)